MDTKKSKNQTDLATRFEGSWLTQNFNQLMQEFRRSFEDLTNPILPWMPRLQFLEDTEMQSSSLDLEDKEDHYRVTVELPGFNKNTVDVKVNTNNLQIRAEKRSENESKNKNFQQRESSYSVIQRTISFPQEVVPSKAETSMKNGVLVITVPKKEQKPAEKLQKLPTRV